MRSVFSFTKKKMLEAYPYFMSHTAVSGCVIISTCNRMELWISVNDDSEYDDFSPFKLLCGFLNVDPSMYEEFFMTRRQEGAVKHLFRLASGLESLIVGEDQIITQVGEALSFSRSAYATDRTMEVLFRLAVTAGKRVKTETRLSTADKSAIHAAIHMLDGMGIGVKGKKCLCIGNGMMGRISAQAMLDAGADVTVTIRQYRSGVVDVPRGCERIDYADRLALLPDSDIVISATSSPNFTLRKDEIKPLFLDHEIFFIDLAVPRDIEQSVAELPNCHVYDIDSFNVKGESKEFRKNLTRAEAILSEYEEEFFGWYQGRDVVSTIQDIKDSSARDVTKRLQRAYRKLSLSQEEAQDLESQVEGAVSRMMNRLLFEMRAKMPEREFLEGIEVMKDTFRVW